MWNAIPYVTSGITLIAFIAAIVAWMYKSKLDERERLIRTAPEGDRGPLVRNALEFLNVETAGLGKEQQYKIALEQIQARGQRFKISAAVICFLAIIGAGITIYAIALHGRHPDRSSAAEAKGVDPGLVGAWEGPGSFNGQEMQLHFQVGANGTFFRKYFRDTAGIVDVKGGMLIDNKPPEKWLFIVTDANSLVLSKPNETLRFDLKRVDAIEDPENPLVGKWNGSVFSYGASWEITVEVGRDRKYRSHTEARDEGPITAANNKYELISSWNTSPIKGSYMVISPDTLISRSTGSATLSYTGHNSAC